MTYTIELSPEIEERVRAAREMGIDVDAQIVEALRTLPTEAEDQQPLFTPSTPRPNAVFDPLLKELLERNRPKPETLEAFSAEVRANEEALARMTLEEIADAERELNKFLEALDRNCRDAGERPLYPE